MRTTWFTSCSFRMVVVKMKIRCCGKWKERRRYEGHHGGPCPPLSGCLLNKLGLFSFISQRPIRFNPTIRCHCMHHKSRHSTPSTNSQLQVLNTQNYWRYAQNWQRRCCVRLQRYLQNQLSFHLRENVGFSSSAAADKESVNETHQLISDCMVSWSSGALMNRDI